MRHSPKMKSRSPKRRSPSPKRRSPSPKRRSPSPKRRSPSPKRRSPTRRSPLAYAKAGRLQNQIMYHPSIGSMPMKVIKPKSGNSPDHYRQTPYMGHNM